MEFKAEEFNALFSDALSRGGEALEKVGEVTGLYIQDKLRENSFARKILPPQSVTEAELTRRVDDEGLEYIDDIEPDSIAMRVNWRSEPDKTMIQGKRYAIRLSTISSDRFVKSEQELRSYRMPLTKVIEQNTIKDMQEVQDKTFMDHVKAALMLGTRKRMNDLVSRGSIVHHGNAGATASSTAHKNWANRFLFASYLFSRVVGDTSNGGLAGVGAPNTAWGTSITTAHANYNPANANHSNILMSAETTFSRTVLRDVVKIQAAREMKAKVFLLHEIDWTDVMGWMDTEAGLQITGEIVRDGYKYTTVGGYTFVTTIRDNPDIVQPGCIFTFPAPEFMGRFLILENTKFWINKNGRFIEMEAWEDSGIGFGNIKGIGLIMLRGAQITLPNVFATITDTSAVSTGTFVLTNNVAAPVA
jgi:hypothetical protein